MAVSLSPSVRVCVCVRERRERQHSKVARALLDNRKVPSWMPVYADLVLLFP